METTVPDDMANVVPIFTGIPSTWYSVRGLIFGDDDYADGTEVCSGALLRMDLKKIETPTRKFQLGAMDPAFSHTLKKAKIKPEDLPSALGLAKTGV